MTTITKSDMDTIGFIPEIWANEVLRVLKPNLVLARTVARDVDFNTPQSPGDVINITYPGTFTAQSKSEGTPVTPQSPSGGAKVSVTLNKYKTVDYVVEDFAAAQSNQDLLARYTEPAAVAIATAIENDLFALYSGLSQSVGTSGTDLEASTIRSVVKTLNDAKVPVSDRYLVISPKDHIALLGDSNLASYFANANPEAVRRGELGPLYGMNVFMSQLVPVVTGTPDSTKNLGYHKEAFILATRPFRPIPEGVGVKSANVNDPDTGISIRVLYSYDMDNRGMRIAFDVLYGVAELRDVAGVVVLS
jgi:hypothetical protein